MCHLLPGPWAGPASWNAQQRREAATVEKQWNLAMFAWGEPGRGWRDTKSSSGLCMLGLETRWDLRIMLRTGVHYKVGKSGQLQTTMMMVGLRGALHCAQRTDMGCTSVRTLWMQPGKTARHRDTIGQTPQWSSVRAPAAGKARSVQEVRGPPEKTCHVAYPLHWTPSKKSKGQGRGLGKKPYPQDSKSPWSDGIYREWFSYI